MKHPYIYSEGSGLIVRISDTERPEINNYRIATTEIEVPEYDENWFNSDLKDWLSSCQSHPVAKGEEEKFFNLANSVIINDSWSFGHTGKTLNEILQQGIKLPPENVEIKQVPETDERNTVYHATYAYFKESKAEEDLPTDKEIQKHAWHLYNTNQNIDSSEMDEYIEGIVHGAKWMRDHILKNFNLIPKEK